MSIPESILVYLHMFGSELGERIVRSYPALNNAQDPVSPRLRKPFPAQAVGAMAFARKWQKERSAAVVAIIAECGITKTLISLAPLDVRSNGAPFTAIAMARAISHWCGAKKPGKRLISSGAYMDHSFDYATGNDLRLFPKTDPG